MPPAKGDNAKKVEDQRTVLFFSHVEARLNIDAKLAELRSQRKKATGLAKADGIKAKRLDHAIAAMSAKDEQAFVDEFAADCEVLEWLGMIPSFQPDLFRQRMPQDERIEKAGRLAGLTNRPRESGYAADSRETQTWLKAFDKATKLRTDNLADALEQAEKARQADTKKTKGKAAKSKAGAPLTGDTPDDAKKAANDDRPTPPKPPKPDAEKTNAEKEAERQDGAAFH